MKNKDFNFMGLSPEAILTLQDIKEKESSGKIMDAKTTEALKAIDLASKVVNTIMSGNQIDPVFFKKLSDMTQAKMEKLSEPSQIKKIIKTRKFKKKI